jgi:hypothetical protein
MEQALLTRRQDAELGGVKRLEGVSRLDGELNQAPAVPAGVAGDVTRVGDLLKPTLSCSLGSLLEMNGRIVRTPAKPVLFANTVDDRPANPMAGEHPKWDPSCTIEPRGCFDKALRAVTDEILELDAPPYRKPSEAAGYRSDEVKVSLDSLVTRDGLHFPGWRRGVSCGCGGRRDPLHVLTVLRPIKVKVAAQRTRAFHDSFSQRDRGALPAAVMSRFVFTDSLSAGAGIYLPAGSIPTSNPPDETTLTVRA